jgi:hypothetical protein
MGAGQSLVRWGWLRIARFDEAMQPVVESLFRRPDSRDRSLEKMTGSRFGIQVMVTEANRLESLAGDLLVNEVVDVGFFALDIVDFRIHQENVDSGLLV